MRLPKTLAVAAMIIMLPASGALAIEGMDSDTKSNPLNPGSSQPMVKECQDCAVVKGLVLTADYDSLLVKDASKKEVRIHIDKDTRLGQVNMRNQGFLEGDRIEAYVAPNGHAYSINLLKQTHGIPGAEGDVSGG